MSDDIQARAEQEDVTVADPLQDTVVIPNGAEELQAYEAEREAAINGVEEDPQAETPEETPADTLVPDETEHEPQPDEEQPEPKTPDRFRFKDPIDQAVAVLAKAKGISLVEAAQIIAGAPSKSTEAEQQQADEGPSVASVSDEIKTLVAMKKMAMTNLEFETAANIDEQIESLRDQRDELRAKESSENEIKKQQEELRNAVKRQQQEAEFDRAYSKSESNAVTFYPDAAKADSELTKRMIELDNHMRDLGDPLYYSPDKPFILAKAAAKELGIPMAKPGAKPAAAAPPQKAPIQPAPGNRGTTSATAPAAKLDQVIEGLGTEGAYEDFVAGLSGRA